VAVLTWKYWMKPSLDGCHDHDSITRFDEL